MTELFIPKNIQTMGRDAADLMQPGRLKEIILRLCDKLDEVENLNRILNTVGVAERAVPQTDELMELRQRVAQLERQLPNMATIDLHVAEILKQYGYQPRR